MKSKHLQFIIIVIIAVITCSYQSMAWKYRVLTYNNPSPGYLFLDPPSGDTLEIFDNVGGGIIYKILNITNKGAMYFTPHVNGLVSYYNMDRNKFFTMNKQGEVVDSFECAGDVVTDPHDFKILSNGHYLILGFRSRHVDMSSIVDGGKENAIVVSSVIQEFDSNKNLLFEWDGFDHIPVTDATSDISLTDSRIGYMHSNSVCYTNDGNLLLSSRHLDEITKINRTTGAIIWRLGGKACKSNQFRWLNDSTSSFYGFSHQHDIQMLPNGNLLMFDNGNLREPDAFSRAVEFQLDENAKTIKKVWEFRHSPDIQSQYMGSVQRLPNGNTLIGWGGVTHFREGSESDSTQAVTEVTTDGTIALDMISYTAASYQAQRAIFDMTAVTKNISSPGNYSFNETNNETKASLNLTSLTGSGSIWIEKHHYEAHNVTFTEQTPCIHYPYRWVINKSGISSFGGKIKINTSAIKGISNPDKCIIYKRSQEGFDSFSPLTTTYNVSTGEIEGTFSGTGEFIVGTTVIDPPVIISPQNKTANHPINGTITWQKVDYINNYHIQISSTTDFNTAIFDSPVIDAQSFNYTTLNYNQRYYWRIASVSPTCQGGWSEVFTFTTTLRKPELTDPSDNSQDAPIQGTLSWKKVIGAMTYNIQISKGPEFSSIVIAAGTANNSFQYSGLEHSTKYYWRIRAVNDSSASDWSDPFSFTTNINQPLLKFPADSVINIGIEGVLNWNSVEGAEIYKIQIADNSEFINPTINLNGITSTNFSYSGLKYFTKYYWRVRAQSSFSTSDWSNVWTFTTELAPPGQIKPQNNAVGVQQHALLAWHHSEGATIYRIQIATDNKFENVVVDDKNTSTDYYQTTTLEQGKTYFWRLQAINKDGTSKWTEVWSFTTVSAGEIARPGLIFPEDGKLNQPTQITLTWENVNGAVSYRLQVSNNIQFTDLILDKSDVATNNLEISSIAFNRTYYWRVLVQTTEKASDWSDVWSFKTELSKPSLVYPENESVDLPLSFVLKWTGIEAKKFVIQLSQTEDFEQVVDYSSFDNQFTLAFLKESTLYYWRVKSYDGETESKWTDAWAFTTMKNSSGIFDGIDASVSVTAYPNPFSRLVIIGIKSDVQRKASFSIFDNTGNDIYHAVIYLNSGMNNIEWTPGENSSSGLYFYKIISGNDFTSGPIIYQK